MANPAHITHFGLPGIGRIPFGMHTCHLYNNRDQLVAALVPYFVAGLRGNERCLWITAPPLPASEAISALRDKMFEKLEAAVDRCENVANIIESVIIKHT